MRRLNGSTRFPLIVKHRLKDVEPIEDRQLSLIWISDPE